MEPEWSAPGKRSFFYGKHHFEVNQPLNFGGVTLEFFVEHLLISRAPKALTSQILHT